MGVKRIILQIIGIGVKENNGPSSRPKMIDKHRLSSSLENITHPASSPCSRPVYVYENNREEAIYVNYRVNELSNSVGKPLTNDNQGIVMSAG